MDGAHTHHGHGGSGIGTVILVVFGLAVVMEAAHAVAAILPALLIGLAATAGLALTAQTACAVITCLRHHAAWHQSIPGPLPPVPDPVPLAADREVVSLRQAITELHAQLVATRALDSSHSCDAHQHLHFHGLDPAEAAAILAAYRREAGEGE
jgi:hypothetical protein